MTIWLAPDTKAPVMQQRAREKAYDKAADTYLKEGEPTEGRKHG